MKDTIKELQREISAKEIKGPGAVAQADALEHQLYREIDTLLEKGDEKANACLDRHSEDITYHARLLYDLHHIYYQLPFLFFTSIDQNLIPTDWKKTELEFMREQFQFFTKNCLTFQSHDAKQKEHFLVLVRQLISRPEGQALIVQLNQFTQNKGFTILISGNDAFGVTPEESEDGIIRSVKLFYPEAFHSVEKFYLLNGLTFGKTHSIVFQPTFISLGHELIHALHFFRQEDKRKIPIPAPYNHPLVSALFKGSFEELTTIDLGDLSENSLRREHGINQRFGHGLIMKCIHPDIHITTIEKTREQILNHLTSTLSSTELIEFLAEKTKLEVTVTMTIPMSKDFRFSAFSKSPQFFPDSDNSRMPLLVDDQENRCGCCIIL